MKVRWLSVAVLVLCCGSAQISSGGVATWTSIGPEGGTVRALAIDPVNPTIVYAGTVGGGIFKSTDGGGHWTAANTGLGYWAGGYWTGGSASVVNAFAIDPSTPTILYAATGAGVFRSIDAGGSWTVMGVTEYGHGRTQCRDSSDCPEHSDHSLRRVASRTL